VQAGHFDCNKLPARLPSRCCRHAWLAPSWISGWRAPKTQSRRSLPAAPAIPGIE